MVCLMPYDGLGLHFYTLSHADKEAYFKVGNIYSGQQTYEDGSGTMKSNICRMP